MSSYFNNSRDGGMPPADMHQQGRPQNYVPSQHQPSNYTYSSSQSFNYQAYGYNNQQYHNVQPQYPPPPYHNHHYSYAAAYHQQPPPVVHNPPSTMPQQHYISMPHQHYVQPRPDYNPSNMLHQQYYNNTATRQYHTAQPDMQHSNTTINQSNNKKQKVKQEAEAVQSSSIDDIKLQAVQSSSIDDIKLPAVQSSCEDDIQLPLGIELPPHPFAMDYPDTSDLQCTYFLTNEQLMLMLPSNLKTTKYHTNGHSYTILELDQIDDMEEVGYQKNYNDSELAFITPLLKKYMPNYEVDNYSKPKLIKSRNPLKADDGWEYESRTYRHAENDDHRIKIIRATNGRYFALLFCPNQQLFPLLYNQRARDKITNATGAVKLSALATAFYKPISNVSDSTINEGNMEELAVRYGSKSNKLKVVHTKETVAASHVPDCMVNRFQERYNKETQVERDQMRESEVSGRLELIATGVLSTDREMSTKITINTKYRKYKRAMLSVVPFCHISSNGTYQCVYIDDEDYNADDDKDLPDLPDPVLINNKALTSNYNFGRIKYDSMVGPRIVVVNGYAYLLVGDHFNNDRLDIVAKTCDEIGQWDFFPVILQMLCANEVYKQCNTTSVADSISGGSKKSRWCLEKNSEHGWGLCKFIEGFVSLCFTSLVCALDFYAMDINVVFDRMSWVLWNLLAFEFYNYVDKDMQRRMDKMKELLEERVESMLPGVDKSSNEFRQLYNTIRENCRDFHYLIIMSISHSSNDANTRNCYERLMSGKLDGKSLLEDIGRLKDFLMYFDGMVEILRSYSLYTQRALLVITLAVTSVVDCAGDIPRGDLLLAVEQIRKKKQRITENTKAMFTRDMNDFVGIGVDTHVERAIKILIYVYLTKCADVDIDLKQAEKYVDIVVDWIDPSIGVYCNEILAQLGQYMESNSDEVCKEILKEVFDKVGADNKLYEEVIKIWKKKEK